MKDPGLTLGSCDELAADMRLKGKALSLIVGLSLVWHLEGLPGYLSSVFVFCINDWSNNFSHIKAPH